MRINWFKDQDHLVYINGATQLEELERTLHFPGLTEAAPHAGGLYHQGPQAHQRAAVRAGSGLWRAYRDGGEHLLLHGGDAGVLRHLLAGRAGGEMTESAAMP